MDQSKQKAREVKCTLRQNHRRLIVKSLDLNYKRSKFLKKTILSALDVTAPRSIEKDYLVEDAMDQEH